MPALRASLSRDRGRRRRGLPQGAARPPRSRRTRPGRQAGAQRRALMETGGDKPHILVVDDDTRLRELLKSFLSRNGFRVSTAKSAAEARQHLDALDFDLIVLDVMMPGETGLEFAGELRRTDDVPILMLTAMADPKDRIAGLEKGVDDYLGKPFEPRELLLRIQSILRRGRSAAETSATPERVTFGPFQFDLVLGELTQKAERVPLTDAEIALLRALGARLGEVLSREALCKSVGGGANERAIDVQVTRLRRKIEPDPGFPRYLRTVRGQGYRLVDA